MSINNRLWLGENVLAGGYGGAQPVGHIDRTGATTTTILGIGVVMVGADKVEHN